MKDTPLDVVHTPENQYFCNIYMYNMLQRDNVSF